ncbi:hypothetical protein FKW77_005259 [Venturia effusa]|uniref:FAD-binding FR-type domain-containing protein n=1 Tax=Venturia effusa TaxID=50376 RepID=A0A517LQ96_9PEZI|nr:hypothetical protein FKW77_005259 [Venturia effusa]
MRASIAVSCVALLGLPVVSALSPNEYCVDGIYTALTSVIFNGSTAAAYVQASCLNPLKVESIYASANRYCTDHELSAGIAWLSETCLTYGLELLPYTNFKENFTQDYLDSLRTIEYGETITETVSTVVIISESYYDLGYRTIENYDFQEWSNYTYGYAMYGFWGGIILIGIITNAYNSLWHSRSARESRDPEDSSSSAGREPSTGRIAHWVQSSLSIPTLFGTHRRRLWFSFAVPTRLEALIIVSFWALSIILCSVNIRAFEGNLYYPLVSSQVWRYVGNRTAIICYSNLPVIWMFSGRNNIFLWATGWTYATFNVFHRHVARVATIQAIVHAISFSYLYRKDSLWAASLKLTWFYMGIAAVVTLSSLLLFSSVWLRRKSYEIFLLLHIALSVLLIVSLFQHSSVWKGLYDPYLWPLVAIWSFDRFLRLVRLVYCNVRIRFSKDMLHLSSSVITYDQDSDVIRAAVVPAHTMLTPKPGQFYYLYQPLGWKGWENHPFSLGSFTRPGQSSPPPSVSSREEEWNKEALVSGQTSNRILATNSSADGDVVGVPQQLTFFIRPFDGWTRRLANRCLDNPSKTASSRLLIEGPYGHSSQLHNYESILLIAGGTGISANLPYMEEHIYRQAKGMPLRTRQMELLLAGRKPGFIHDLCAKELRPMLGKKDIKTSFFSTAVVQDYAHKENDNQIDDQGAGAERVDIINGRPDITNAIREAARVHMEGGSESGRLAILVCGPAGMADEARSAVAKVLKEGCKGIEYIEETFGW